MALREHLLWVSLLASSVDGVHAQSNAALGHMLQRYGTEGVEAMREQAHYRYESTLVFYASSFLVIDDGQLRQASEEEIALVDIAHYDAERKKEERMRVRDAALGKELVLLGRIEFEALVSDQLSADDRAAYQAFKSAASVGAQQGKQHP